MARTTHCRSRWLAALVLAALACGGSSPPKGGRTVLLSEEISESEDEEERRKGPVLVTRGDETRVGAEASRQVESQMGLLGDPELAAYEADGSRTFWFIWITDTHIDFVLPLVGPEGEEDRLGWALGTAVDVVEPWFVVATGIPRPSSTPSLANVPPCRPVSLQPNRFGLAFGNTLLTWPATGTKLRHAI